MFRLGVLVPNNGERTSRTVCLEDATWQTFGSVGIVLQQKNMI